MYSAYNDARLSRRSELVLQTSFDLPIEFHQDAIAERFDESGNIPFSKVLATGFKWMRRSRFQYLDPEILLLRLKTRPNFAILRYLALEKLEFDVCAALDLFKALHRCRKQDMEGISIPHRMFGWALSDFLARRQLPNVIWVGVVMRQFPPSCLQLAKLSIDIEELERYIHMVFKALQHEGEDDDIDFDVIDCLREVQETNDIYEDLDMEVFQHSLILSGEADKQIMMHVQIGDEKFRKKKFAIEEKLLNCAVMFPMINRYALNYEEARMAQCALEHGNLEKLIEDQIARYGELQKSETHVCHSAVEAYVVQIEQIRADITEFTAKFDIEDDKLEQSISYNRILLDRTRDHRKFLTEEIERFHEEIEQMRLFDQRKRENEQRQIQLAYEAELRRQNKKKGKGKGKGKKGK